MKYISVWKQTTAQAIQRRENEIRENRLALLCSLSLIFVCIIDLLSI
jgi:hypothetical protein